MKPRGLQSYSISNKSKIMIDKGAGVKEGPIYIANSEGWRTFNYSVSLVKVIIQEAGNTSSDSDLVIRVNPKKVKVINLKHEDSSKKGSKCGVCGKVLTW